MFYDLHELGHKVMDDEMRKEENLVVYALKNCESICWGCGLRLVLSSNFPMFKCGWCGSITNHSQKPRKPDNVCFSRWRCLRDRLFMAVVFLFMLFVICAGVWAVYPIVFSISYFCGIFHSSLTAILSTCTLSSFFLASSRSAGAPPNVIWGSYPNVQKGSLEDYTFCTYCAKPKSPRAHHCRSCRMCVLDMDHHCPFIGNCVGAGNHQCFISFLISIVISCTYVVGMAAFAGYHIWPPLEYGPLGSAIRISSIGATEILKEVLVAFANSALVLSPRGLILMYLTITSLSVEIGIGVLLWQQLRFIYEGKTYLNHLISQNEGGLEAKGCQNILRFFGCPHWAFRMLRVSSNAGKLQETSSSKLL